MGFLFGSEPEVTKQNLLTPEQSDAFVNMMNILNANIGRGVPSYPGTYTPPATGNEKQIFDLVKSLLGGTGPMQEQGMESVSSLMEPFDIGIWEKAVKEPALQTWENDIVPGILENFAAYDAAGSGSARTAVSKAGQQLDTSLGSSLADFYGNYQNRQLNAAKAGLGYPETILSSVLTPAMEERNIQAQQGMEGYQDWLMEQPWNNPWLKQFLMPMLSQRTFENVVMPGQKGIFGDLLGAGAKIGGAMINAGWF